MEAVPTPAELLDCSDPQFAAAAAAIKQVGPEQQDQLAGYPQALARHAAPGSDALRSDALPDLIDAIISIGYPHGSQTPGAGSAWALATLRQCCRAPATSSCNDQPRKLLISLGVTDLELSTELAAQLCTRQSESADTTLIDMKSVSNSTRCAIVEPLCAKPTPELVAQLLDTGPSGQLYCSLSAKARRQLWACSSRLWCMELIRMLHMAAADTHEQLEVALDQAAVAIIPAPQLLWVAIDELIATECSGALVVGRGLVQRIMNRQGRGRLFPCMSMYFPSLLRPLAKLLLPEPSHSALPLVVHAITATDLRCLPSMHTCLLRCSNGVLMIVCCRRATGLLMMFGSWTSLIGRGLWQSETRKTCLRLLGLISWPHKGLLNIDLWAKQAEVELVQSTAADPGTIERLDVLIERLQLSDCLVAKAILFHGLQRNAAHNSQPAELHMLEVCLLLACASL